MKLPRNVYSQLGPVPVVMTEGMVKDPNLPSFGMWDEVTRVIKIDPSAHEAAQLSTLFHEMVHVALTDAGANNSMSEQQAETVCDVVGAHFAAAVLAGHMKLLDKR